jgi:hypothetical protein
MYGYKGTFINASIHGIRILATSHFINDEAGSILRPRMSEILATPPTVLVRAGHLVALSRLYYPIDWPRNTLHKIMKIVNKPEALKAIDSYRKGLCDPKSIRNYLYFNDSVADEDIMAIASFILRTAKFLTTDYISTNAHPPIAIVIQLPARYTSTTLHFTTSGIVQFWYRHIVRRHRPATRTRRFILSVIVENMAYRAMQRCLECKKNPVSVVVMLQFVDPKENYSDVSLDETNVRVSVDLGVMRAGNAGERKLVSFGGLYEDEESGSLEG